MTNRVVDSNGWYEIKANPLSKVGVFPYLGKSIGLPGLQSDKIYNVYRPQEELESKETIDSFKLVPWIEDHTMLGENFKAAEEKGIEGVVGEDVFFEYPYLKGNIKMFSNSLEKDIDKGKKDLSLGYRCTYELKSGVFDGEQYDVIQRNLRGNHLASVEEGRMGKDVSVLDKAETQQVETFSIDSKEFAMADENKELKAIMDSLKALTERMDSMDKMVKDMKDSYAKDMEEKEKKAEDEKKSKDEEEKMKKEAEDKGDHDSKDKEEKEAGDSIADLQKTVSDLKATVDSQDKTIADLKANATQTVMKEVTQRDSMAAGISAVVGSFDHAEMSLNDVAKYGVEKLEITCEDGQEITAVNSYLAAMKKAGGTVAGDSAEPKTSKSVDSYLSGGNE